MAVGRDLDIVLDPDAAERHQPLDPARLSLASCFASSARSSDGMK